MGNKSSRKAAAAKEKSTAAAAAAEKNKTTPTTANTSTKSPPKTKSDERPARRSFFFRSSHRNSNGSSSSGSKQSSKTSINEVQGRQQAKSFREPFISGDFNRESILKELSKYNINRNNPSVKKGLKPKYDVDHHLVYAELRKLNLSKNALNYYGIENSNEVISNVLCSTCFSRDQQIDLVKLLIDSDLQQQPSPQQQLLQQSNKKAASKPGDQLIKVNVDDLYLSCIEASSIKVSNILLDKLIERSQPHPLLKELLASGLNRVYSTSKHAESKRKNRSNILNVSLFKFKCAIQIHTNYLVSVNTNQIRTTFFENQSFIIKLLDAGCRLNNADLEDPLPSPFLFLFLFLNTSHLGAREQQRFDKYLNRGLRYYLRHFQSFDLSTLPRGWLPKACTHDELKTNLYYLIKKSPFTNWSTETRARLSQLVTTNQTINRFQPLSLQQLSRSSLKRRLDLSKDHTGYLPNFLRRHLRYEQEQIDSLTFYLIQ